MAWECTEAAIGDTADTTCTARITVDTACTAMESEELLRFSQSLSEETSSNKRFPKRFASTVDQDLSAGAL